MPKLPKDLSRGNCSNMRVHRVPLDCRDGTIVQDCLSCGQAQISVVQDHTDEVNFKARPVEVMQVK